MAKVIANMSMSLDGFVADDDERVDLLFGWYGSGPIITPTANPGVTFRTSQRDADHLRATMAGVGALVTGRHLFDYTQGWGGGHPLGVPVFVVTHRPPPDDWPVTDPPFTFITGGIIDAVTQAAAAAGEHAVAVASATTTQQCLNAGLLDELHVDLIPVLLRSGVRWFDQLQRAFVLGNPSITEGDGVTHLTYPINRR